MMDSFMAAAVLRRRCGGKIAGENVDNRPTGAHYGGFRRSLCIAALYAVRDHARIGRTDGDGEPVSRIGLPAVAARRGRKAGKTALFIGAGALSKHKPDGNGAAFGRRYD